ncbi:MAG: tetratricopeptide repeat protein [Acidobacteriota bacterium]
MNRENLLYAVIGILCGFITGYVAHEAIESNQPPPAWMVRAALQAGTDGAVGPGAEGTGGLQASTGTPAPAESATTPPQAMAGMQEVQRLRAYVAENPQDADAVRTLANLNYDIQNWQRAVELYESYLELRPDDIDVLTDLGAAYRQMQRPEQALDAFRRVREQAPDHWQATYNEVLVLAFDLERGDEARRALADLQEMQPENPEVARLAEAVEQRL